MNKVLDVRAESDGCVFVELADGRTGLFDVHPYLQTDYYRELENPEYFRQVRIFFRGIGWPNGQDFSPDTIAAELKEVAATRGN